MDLMNIYYHYQFTYYKFLVYKLKFREAWQQLSRVTRCIYFCGVCFGTAFAGYLAYRFLERTFLTGKSDFNAVEDVDDKVVRSNRRRKGAPPGLFNDGNTCFLNCVMQALSSSASFYKWTEDVLATHDSSNITLIPSVHTLLKVLTNRTGNEDVYSAGDIVASFHSHGWVISNEQQDAYEFLQVVTSTMEEELDKLNDANIPSNDLLDIKLQPQFTSTICSKVSKRLPCLLANKDIVSPLKGSYASKLTCIACGHQLPVKFETFECLILNLANISPFSATLDSCLQEWIKPELLHQVECETCVSNYGRMYSTFSKGMSLAKLPSCLCIQFQRTCYSTLGIPQKNAMFVQFPELLDVAKYTYGNLLSKGKEQDVEKRGRTSTPGNCPLRGGSNKDVEIEKVPQCTTLYCLNSVIVHLGGADGGHFITCRKMTAADGSSKWFHISDALVKVVPKDQVLRSVAYLLFYEKV